MAKTRDGQEAQTLRWKPRMKDAAKRSRSLSSSGTAEMADIALSGMCTINKLLAQGRDVDEPYVAKLAARSRTSAAATTTSKPHQSAAGTPSRARSRLLFAGAAVACAIGAAWFALGSGALSSRHTIAGKVWLDRRPLGNSELRFHSTGQDDTAATVVAAQDGKFELKGIPSGKYRVTVHPPAGSTVAAIATNYTKPESTPFQVLVNRDVNSLQLYAHKVLPKARKRTWTPGVD